MIASLVVVLVGFAVITYRDVAISVPAFAYRVRGRTIAIEAANPSGRSSGITVGDTDIDVYDDGAVIALTISPEAQKRLGSGGTIDILVKAQSCSEDGTCLAPAVLKTTLAGRSI